MRRFLFIVLLVFGVVPFAVAKDLAVVVHKANATKAFPAADLVKILKAANRKWPDGKTITIVMKDPGAADMKVVLQKLLAMSPDEVKGIIAANKGAFVIVDSDQAVVKTVESMPLALGLADVYAITGGVSVLKIEGKSPLEPGYLLHGQ